ncbi:MAG: hypothetical protein IKU53_00760 [Firmicutes bacterium]|nr:hypothetical protein [Bacillota bacterium]
MLRTIKKRIIMLGNRVPFAPEKQKYFEDVEKLDWIHSNLVLEGSTLTKAQVHDIMDGIMPQKVSIEEPIMVEALRSAFDEMYYLAEKGIKPCLEMLGYFNHLITGQDKDVPYRKTTMMAPQWDYVAIHPAEIPEKITELESLFKTAETIDAMTEDCFQMAEKIHNLIIEIMPYGEKDGLLARLMTSYFLMEKGYPAVAPNMKEQDYNEAVTKVLKTRELQGLGEFLKKEVLEHLELMIQLTTH